LSVSIPSFQINHACNQCWQVSFKVYHQLSLILALGRLLAVLMKAHHKLVPSLKAEFAMRSQE
jgi:hypothetical protein